MRAAQGWPLRRHLLALVLAVLLPTLGFAGLLVWRSAEAERDRLEERAAAVARELAASVDRELSDVLTSARVLAGSESLAAGDLAAFHRRAREVIHELGALNVSLRDARSRQVLNTSVAWGNPLPEGARLATVDRRVAETGQPAFSDVYQGLAARNLLFAVVVPLPAGSGAEDAPRFLSLAMPLARVQRIVEREVSLPDGMVAGVTDRAGVFVAHSRDPGRLVGGPAPSRAPRTPELAREGVLDGRGTAGEATVLT